MRAARCAALSKGAHPVTGHDVDDPRGHPLHEVKAAGHKKANTGFLVEVADQLQLTDGQPSLSTA